MATENPIPGDIIGNRELELAEANAARRLMGFIDEVTAKTPYPNISSPVALDGGERSLLVIDPGSYIGRRPTVNTPREGEFVVGTEVFYHAQDSALHVARLTDEYVIRDNREGGYADLVTALGIENALSHGANVDRVATRAVTISRGKDHTGYIVISKMDKPQAVYREREGLARGLSYGLLLRGIFREQGSVPELCTRLSPGETLRAVKEIRDAYTSTSTAMINGYQQEALRRAQAFRG